MLPAPPLPAGQRSSPARYRTPALRQPSMNPSVEALAKPLLGEEIELGVVLCVCWSESVSVNTTQLGESRMAGRRLDTRRPALGAARLRSSLLADGDAPSGSRSELLWRNSINAMHGGCVLTGPGRATTEKARYSAVRAFELPDAGTTLTRTLYIGIVLIWCVYSGLCDATGAHNPAY